VTIDATNPFPSRNEDFESNAHEIKSIVRGPTAKSFNLNFAIRDAGYDPVDAGALDNARMLEDHLALLFAVNQAGLGRFFYRMAQPGAL
jgi:hypothetical protein